VDRRLHHAARQARLARGAWDTVLDRLPGLAWQREIDGASVAVAPFADYDSALGAAVLMAALRRAGGVMGPLRAARLFAFVQRAGSGRRADLGGGWWAELAFGRLHFVRDGDCPESGGIMPLHGTEGEARWGAWEFRWSTGRVPATQAREGGSAWFTPGPLIVRPWVAGERVQPLRGTGHRLVVRCLQEARVPRRHRPGWPVVERAGTILWLPRVARGAEGVPEAGAEGVRVDASFG
jgi:tRNA(Ile)-lysidine synthetase-like protein